MLFQEQGLVRCLLRGEDAVLPADVSKTAILVENILVPVQDCASLRRASEVLHVSQPSISAQLKKLEESLGAPLFTRTTRRLILTDTGQTVLQYAE